LAVWPSVDIAAATALAASPRATATSRTPAREAAVARSEKIVDQPSRAGLGAVDDKEPGRGHRPGSQHLGDRSKD
jgi:hypothetical protein